MKATILKSRLCDYSDVYILGKGTITVIELGADVAPLATDKEVKTNKVIFKNSTPFTDCISEINIMKVDIVKDFDIVMLLYNLTEYNNNYSEESGSFWKYCRDEREDNITDSKSFKFKLRFINNADDDGTVDVEIAVYLKYLGNFWGTLEMSLINCEINVILNWSANCDICEAERAKILQ